MLFFYYRRLGLGQNRAKRVERGYPVGPLRTGDYFHQIFKFNASTGHPGWAISAAVGSALADKPSHFN